MQLFALFLLVGLGQTKPAPPPLVTMPATPKLPTRIAFAEELAGRRAYWAARDASHAAPGYSFQCTLSTLQSSRGRVSPGQLTTETLYAAPGGKLAVSYEYGLVGQRTIRRAVCDGESLLAVRFDERGSAKQPKVTREFSRLYLTQGLRLDRALQSARLDPLGTSLGAQITLEPPRAMQSRLWKDTDGSVLETDTLIPRAGRPVRIRRYRFTTSHALSAAEEWETREGRVTYRKETYRPAPKAAAPFDQALPDNYTEVPLKVPERRDEPQPTQVDPAALALLEKWESAHQRYFTLHAAATVTTEQLKRADNSRDPRGGGRGGYNGTYDLWLQRPGSALIEIKGRDSFPVSQTIKANGVEIVVTESDGKKRTVALREGVRLDLSLRQATLRNALEPLQGLLEGPPSLAGYDTVRLLQPLVLPDGTSLQGVELVRTTKTDSARGRPTTTENSDRIWLGGDGLPRRIETSRKIDIEGAFTRDLPPITILTVQLKNVTTDKEPPL
ncbi:hypothetical protein [Armatimonas sp.]|uniref:hypothetical protein n=1 Tax=Armatimonas sp. TaxID=1872638 RepID=UPI00286C8AF9|nr:hypothetical protein [Armatimonas sp.]